MARYGLLLGLLTLCGIGIALLIDYLKAHPDLDQYVYKTTPAGALRLDILRPDRPSPERGAILFLFGGGWITGQREQFLPQAQYFAQQGWLSVLVDYRVANRHGSTPLDSLEDARDAWDWLQSRSEMLNIDPRQVVLAGGSSGGHLAACLASGCGTRLASPPSALILYNPVLDLVAAHPDDGFSPEEMALIEQLSPAVRVQLSPGRALCQLEMPRLLLFGDQDPLYQRYLELQCADTSSSIAPLEVVTWSAVGHGFFNHSPYLQQTSERIADFLQRAGSADPESGRQSNR
ncbi:alpha/beta hydrolase [Parahaliea aestuarii]|uniref:Alpha/beta hydrolase n=1 Tax=Parahaliea aestuarii TaxID=1852021 RepID=A0A5C8ZPI0_9GAMM|nr:alpha/beta hydrolase [Parahaliea aestuarii]TXS89632.1 alpha/beta hydrolase [Parahaliea aestuarii]